MKYIEEHAETFVAIWCISIITFGFIWLIFQSLREDNVVEQIRYIETIHYATEQEQIEHDREVVETIAKLVYGEARGCSKTEQAAVIWCALNRVDSPDFPDNIIDVITQKNQFSGYKESNPVYEEYVELAEDVLTRWKFEEMAVGEVGRVLPKEYTYFRGDGVKNTFRDAYKEPYNTWDWSLESPYKEDLNAEHTRPSSNKKL